MLFFSGKNKKQLREQIEQIILERYDQYYRLAYSYVHNEADACDIVQNGAYKALRSSHTLEHPEFAATWIYRIMLNECFLHLRKPTCFSYETMELENRPATGYEENSNQTIDLERAINGLAEKEKAIIILKYFEDKTLEEIAEILDENVNTIKSRLYRSMKKLRVVLKEETVSDSQQDALKKSGVCK